MAIARDKFGFTKHDVYIDKFLDQFIDYSSATHRPTTTNRYRAIIDHFRTFLSHDANVTCISEISPALIDRYKVYRRSTWTNGNGRPMESDDNPPPNARKGACARTINFEIDTLRLILNLAIKWGFLTENPTKNISRLKVDDARSVRFLSEEECQRFLQAASPQLYPIYFTFLSAGMRKAELENLTWNDIDFTRDKIAIRSKDDWHPKTGEREIPIGTVLREALLALRKKFRKANHGEYVFAVKRSGRSHNMLRNELKKIARKAGISDLTKVHTLRHTFASLLVMKGVDLPTVMKLMGHSDIQTTMIYAHLAPDHLANAVDKLSF